MNERSSHWLFTPEAETSLTLQGSHRLLLTLLYLFGIGGIHWRVEGLVTGRSPALPPALAVLVLVMEAINLQSQANG